MPDLALTAEQQLLRNAARDFIERECPLDLVRRIDDEGGFSHELWEKTAALGWQAILVPPAYGGEGGSLTDAAVLYEELGRGLLPGPHLSSSVLGALLLLEGGSEEQRQRLLPLVARGERVLALAFTEAVYGWEAEHVHMPAEARADGFVLSGEKLFVPDAGFADEIIVAARTGDGLTLLLVDREASGVECRPMGGFVGKPLFEVAFRDVPVPRENVIGRADAGWEVLAPVLDRATALLCAYIAGAIRRVCEISFGYAQRREQFGQPIARFQRVQDHSIAMVNHADAAHWTAYEAVWKLEHDMPDAPLAVSVAKAVASEGFYQACEAAHHLHGGIGSDKAYGLYLYTKKSRSLYHYLGDPAHHRRRIADLLGL